MIYFCDKCWIIYYFIYYIICRLKLFSFFGCFEYIKICSYFCDNCKIMRCSDCILINGKCFGYKIIILLNYVLKEKVRKIIELYNFMFINFLNFF